MYVAMGAEDKFYWINKCNEAKSKSNDYAYGMTQRDMYRRQADWYCAVADQFEKMRAITSPGTEPQSRFVPPPIPDKPPDVPPKTWNELWKQEQDRRRRQKQREMIEKLAPFAMVGIILLLVRR